MARRFREVSFREVERNIEDQKLSRTEQKRVDKEYEDLIAKLDELLAKEVSSLPDKLDIEDMKDIEWPSDDPEEEDLRERFRGVSKDIEWPDDSGIDPEDKDIEWPSDWE